MTDIEQLQSDYLCASDRDYRRAAGQFFTPRWIARGMASWVIATKPQRIIDPAFGLGILLDECERQNYHGELTGFEKDVNLVNLWEKSIKGHSSIELKAVDFLTAIEMPIEAAIVNPPYNRFQNRDLPDSLQLKLAEILGESASGFTNQYALFIYLIVSSLAHDGRAAFIVPSEFLATGYGVQVKRFLKKTGRLRHLVIFDTENRIFQDAATTACILLFDAGLCSTLAVWHLAGEHESAKFESICSNTKQDVPDAIVTYQALDPSLNWQGLGRELCDSTGFVPLVTFGKVKRGIATGANEFFVLSRTQAAALDLDSQALVPCIANAGSTSGILFSQDHWLSLHKLDRPCYLFDGVAAEGESVKKYVADGEIRGLHERYLTRMRQPWYRLESRSVTPLLLAVFGREGFRVILNQSNAVNLTAFHGFYPKPGFDRFVTLIWLYFQTPIARTNYAVQQRAYGDGLKKLEPGDWSKLDCPDWRDWDQDSLAQGLTLAHHATSCDNRQLDVAVAEMTQLVRANRVVQILSPQMMMGEQLSLVS